MQIMNEKQVSMELPTAFGRFRLTVWDGARGRELVALSTVNIDPKKEVMVRIHSECLSGDVFHSHTCDCGPQKDLALKMIQEHGNGIFIYHRQEGRNEGFFKKVQGYNLMQEGLDTHEAYLKLVDRPDGREYSDVLTALGFLLSNRKSDIRLLTNNPYKTLFLERHGHHVVAEPLKAGTNIHNASYTLSKEQKFLHGSVGYGPYVAVTLFRKDIRNKGNDIAALLNTFYISGKNRKVFLGIAVSSHDLKDSLFLKELETFHRTVSTIQGVHLVLHMNYPVQRREQRDVARFLQGLSFPYSLQFRLASNLRGGTKVDVELIDSFHAEHVIFQIKDEHFYLLEQKSFAEYFSSPNKFLLLDESWGRGEAKNFLARQKQVLKAVSLGLSRVAVAGGFTAENAPQVHQLEDYFKIPISVDAESGLYTGGKIDLVKVRNYLSFFFSQSH